MAAQKRQAAPPAEAREPQPPPNPLPGVQAFEPAMALPKLAKPARVETADRVELVSAADLKPEPIRWLWPGWLARGKLHVLAGAPGTGKTTLALDIAACVTSGRALPSGCRPKPASVIVWSGEDDPGDTLVPRLIAARADLRRVHIVGDVMQDGQRCAFDPARDVPKLAAACAHIDDVALLIVDPLVSAVQGDSHKNAEVRRGLAPLVELAARMDSALLGITHFSKGTQGRDPLERVSGSLAFGALARVVMGTIREQVDADDAAAPRSLVVARAKSNIGPDGDGFRYSFEQTELANHAGITASRIAWGAALKGAATELLGEPEPTREQPDGDDAASFLRELLADGSKAAKDVFSEAAAAGYSKAAMHRARRKIGAETEKVGMSGGWYWRLPGAEGNAEGAEGDTQKGLTPSTPSGPIPSPSGDQDGNGVVL
ncbi:MAG: AAA family ATPase [Metallibacterium scheffleri]